MGSESRLWPRLSEGQGVFDAGLLLLHLDFGGCADLDEQKRTEEEREIRKKAARYEANRLKDIAQKAAHLRWQVYEKMAARSAAEFPADGRRELYHPPIAPFAREGGCILAADRYPDRLVVLLPKALDDHAIFGYSKETTVGEVAYWNSKHRLVNSVRSQHILLL